MKRTKCCKVIYPRISAIFLVVILAFMAFICVEFVFMSCRQKNFQEQLSTIEFMLQDEYYHARVFEADGDLMDEVSTALGIISAGIVLFTVFGGFLSVFNILKTRELENAIKDADKALENQRELFSNRLLQEGRVYAMRNRNKYAADSFNAAMRYAPETLAALTAEYELFALYSDVLSNARNPFEESNLSYIVGLFNELIKNIENNDDYSMAKHRLKADSYFTLGCVYGTYALSLFNVENIESDYLRIDEFVSEAINAFNEAIKCDGGNVDFHRNLSIIYAVNDNIDECQRTLQNACVYADTEKLYRNLVDSARLTKLFAPSQSYLSGNMKEMLIENYGIEFDN